MYINDFFDNFHCRFVPCYLRLYITSQYIATGKVNTNARWSLEGGTQISNGGKTKGIVHFSGQVSMDTSVLFKDSFSTSVLTRQHRTITRYVGQVNMDTYVLWTDCFPMSVLTRLQTTMTRYVVQVSMDTSVLFKDSFSTSVLTHQQTTMP